MMMRPWMMIFVFAVACSDATPNGTVFFSESLEDTASQSVKVSVALPGEDAPAKLELSLGIPDSGEKRIASFTGTVVESAGWEITYEGKGNPINQGTTTEPVMALPIKVQRYKKVFFGTQTRQDVIMISADGTATVL